MIHLDKWYLLLLANVIFLMPFGFIAAQCPALVWSDEFEGMELDTTKWSYQIGDGCDINLCGWGNNELQWYQSSNVEVNNGTLKIAAKLEQAGDSKYTSGRILTKGKADFTYGRFEASIKLPSGRGIWPAFWMLPTDEVYGSWPQSGEIDIVELFGKESSVIAGTVHYGPLPPNNQLRGNEIRINEGTFSDEFHEYAIEWEPGVIRWYLDGYQYSSQNSGQVRPWPFDQNFHFLLNVAVGGNPVLPPDGSTRFPSVMEVDYVRVYDRGSPSISGSRSVENRAAQVTYAVNNFPEGATFKWSVPDGANIVAGAGTASVTVDFGDVGGKVQVQVESSCETVDLFVDVAVEPPFVKAISFENFDDEAMITYLSSTGTLQDNAVNPSKSGVNTSDLVGQYTRNGMEQFDVLVYDAPDFDSAEPFIEGEHKFFIDVYTDAAVGTTILLQLENSFRANPENYPAGRNSRYTAKTTLQNQWERLEFNLLDQPDATTRNFSIDQIVILFATNTVTSNTFYFDNFDVYGPGEVVDIANSIRLDNGAVQISPNPSNGMLSIENKSEYHLNRLDVFDISGKSVFGKAISLTDNQRDNIDLTHLSKGTYLIRLERLGEVYYLEKVVLR